MERLSLIGDLRDVAWLLEALPGRNPDEDRALNRAAVTVREAETALTRRLGEQQTMDTPGVRQEM